MYILVINVGSSSVKFTLYSREHMRPTANGQIDRIGLEAATVHYRSGKGERIFPGADIADINDGVNLISELLTDPQAGVIASEHEITVVGHRVVHGGEKMKAAVLIDEEVKSTIRACFDLAPLHNPANLKGIEASEERFPRALQVAVFDTAFHSTLPDNAYLYALPHELYETDKIRRYGFHGTSHCYVSRRAAETLGRPLRDLKIVTCHLGNGCSITAVDGGRSVDTTMGFTPLEGLPMGTRCGDIDPAILLYLMRQRDLSVDQLETLLNQESGFLGLGGIGTSDMRDIEAAMLEGDPGARRVIDVFAYRIKKFIGAYAFAMGGLDSVVFTAGIGENSPLIRERVCAGLEDYGIVVDEDRNHRPGGSIREIQHQGGRVRILVIPTDEEKEIASQALELVSGAT
ncbi:MAG: acetate kinase [Actinomycetia bacterium]|nr:acetate kinase [bacterium]MCP4958050.1 acetate kinase [Actinomycetes bacterium]